MASSKGIRAGSAFVEIGAIDKTKRILDSVARRFQKVGQSILGIGAKLTAFGAAAGAPMLFAIKKASDLEETMNKFNVVFGDNAESVKAWGDQYAASVGRSEKQVADFLASSQDLFVPIGFDSKSAEELSKSLTGLAVDVASFNNKADEDVLRDFHAALTGGGETVKKYGVILNVAAEKAELLNMGIEPSNATNAQKVMARYNILLGATTAAQGDAVRSGGSFANMQKRLMGLIDDTASTIGAELLPMATDLVGLISKVVKGLGDWTKQNRGVFRAIVIGVAALVGLGAALIGLGLSITVVGMAISALATAVGIAGSVIGFLVSPIGLVTAAIVGLVGWAIHSSGVFSQMAASFAASGEFIKAVFGGIIDALSAGEFQLAADIAMGGLRIAFSSGLEYLQLRILDFKQNVLATWYGLTKALIQPMADALKLVTMLWIGAQEQMGNLSKEAADFARMGAEISFNLLPDAVNKERAGNLQAIEDEKTRIAEEGARKRADLETELQNNIAKASQLNEAGQKLGDNIGQSIANNIQGALGAVKGSMMTATAIEQGSKEDSQLNQQKAMSKSLERIQASEEKQESLLSESRDLLTNIAAGGALGVIGT